MALGTILGTVAGSAASALAGRAASSLFGGDESPSRALRSGSTNLNRLARARPFNIDAGGLSSSLDGRTVSVSGSPERQAMVSGIASLFPEQAGLISDLRARVAPGMGELRESRLDQIESARRRSIGNLRDNLARRRVLGSSFGTDAIARAEAEFAQQSEQVAAESFLQELDLTNQLVNQEFETRRGEFQTFLDEMNLQADLASDIAAKASSELAANARMKAQLDARLAQERASLLAREQEGTGRFIGQQLQPGLDALSSGVSDLFSGNSNAGALGPNTFAPIGSVVRGAF